MLPARPRGSAPRRRRRTFVRAHRRDTPGGAAAAARELAVGTVFMPGDRGSVRKVPVDLNADLGEGLGVWRLGDDDALLEVVTSANVACGFHAGDPATMARVCRRAAERGVTIGAQVSYRDL